MNLRAKRRYLRELVEAKNRSFPPLTDEEKAVGFLGWHQRGYLPHCDYPGLVQFVTFRLKDSMPAVRKGEWEHLLSIEDEREKRSKLEDYLDQGIGECHLRDERAAILTEHALRHGHEETHELLAWCVMPNHVHVLVHTWSTPLRKLLQSWKSFSAGVVNESLGRNGSFWEPDYWDTFMRDEEQERKAIHYIENNPVKAKLCRTAEEWRFSSARFRDEYRRLVIPDESGTRSSSSARS
ncbi:MAG TPA: transposase [Verrucomicrobiota bacterium]|nr:transposase [Verrucomicrobiota bacterium]